MSDGAKAFVDTNVFLYLYGSSDLAKQHRSEELILHLGLAKRLVISRQVVQEFYVSARRLKIVEPVLESAMNFMLNLKMVTIQQDQIRAAIAKEKRYRISFWDALILAAAESGGAKIVFTEDLNHGQRYGSVLVQNPFTSPRS